jgi:hypothetical protein
MAPPSDDGDELSNTDLDSNRMLYQNQIAPQSDGVSPIKVEDESEDITPTPGGRLR